MQYFKQYLLVITFFCASYLGNIGLVYAASLNSDIINVSNKIIDNNVQIKLIDNYISNLNKAYESQEQQLLKNRKEFQTSVDILYKLTIKPKETLLVQNFQQDQILNVYVIINYWLKHASANIYKIYSGLNQITANTKKLNLAQQKLLNLNQTLLVNKQFLAKLIKQNNLNGNNINQVNQIRQNLKYSALNVQNNESLFDSITAPSLTKEEIALDSAFIKINKGLMAPPSNGYIYSHFKGGDYYSINYYGLVFVALPNSNILAPAAGEVIFLNALDKYNTVIIIKHSPSFISIISGEFNSHVKLANHVSTGQILGSIGSATKPIYFELQNKNNPIDPEQWLVTKGASTK